MKVLKRDFERDGSGYAVLIPEESEDLWHLYNLVTPGDHITATTIRKVQREADTGSVFTETKKVVLTLKIKSSEYDPPGNILRFSGQNCTETPYIRLGQFHTHEITLGSKVTLTKDEWDFFAREKLKEACDPKTNAESVVILMETGIANMYLLTSSLAKYLCKVEVDVPKKRAASTGREKALAAFFSKVLASIVQHINFEIVKCIAVAGPGFLPDDFLKWMGEEAVRQGLTQVTSHRHCFLSCKASTAHKQSLTEVLADKGLAERMANTKALNHTAALEELYQTLHSDPERACYGPAHVAFAIERGAVKTLMVTDCLFRSADIPTRRRYIQMTETAKRSGANVLIFSDMHVSGEQLQQLSGVAAILRYPLPELDDIEIHPTGSQHQSTS